MNYEAKPGIYILTNRINGKVYVGESMNVGKRIKEHGRKGKNVISKAIEKYGFDNFDLKVTYYPYADKKFLINLEYWLIKTLDSLTTGNGYNVCQMGKDNTGVKFTADHCAKIAEANRGRVHSAETRKKISEAQMGNRNTLGYKHSPEFSRTLSELKLGNKNWKGKTLSAEHRAKIGESQRARHAQRRAHDAAL